MKHISNFINNKAYFGGYPTQQQVEEYQKSGFRYFVNDIVPNVPLVNPHSKIDVV